MKKTLCIILMAAFAFSALAQEPAKVYELKSGIVKTVMTVMGQEVASTMYFDDYGAKQSTVVKMSSPMTGDIEITTILKDGRAWLVNSADKSVQEIAAPESVPYLALTDAVIEKYNIKELGEEEACGKPCKKYSLTVTEQGQKAESKVWVWKGLPMKTVISMQGMDITTEVSELTENAFVLPSMFELPE